MSIKYLPSDRSSKQEEKAGIGRSLLDSGGEEALTAWLDRMISCRDVRIAIMHECCGLGVYVCRDAESMKIGLAGQVPGVVEVAGHEFRT